ncbi:hypothetical protein Tco_0138600 [Tanacetum coccineum]
MAQQPQRDVPQDQLCPPDKRFDLMDVNKKFDLVNPQCPNESKILMDDANDKFKFFLDTKELTLTVADFRRIFQLPQATDNNNTRFVVAPSFSQMLPFFLNDIGFKLQLRLPSHLCQKDSHNHGRHFARSSQDS